MKEEYLPIGPSAAFVRWWYEERKRTLGSGGEDNGDEEFTLPHLRS